MKYQFFTIPANAPDAAQDEVNQFCAGHRVVNLDKQFVQDGQLSYWALCVCYLDGEEGDTTTPRKSKIDYREVLSEEDFDRYAQLRTLRKTLAEQQGVPTYNLFTNEQLANIVRNRVTSKEALAKIEGIGETRVEKYSPPFLEMMQALLSKTNQSADKKAKP